jgi:hypothetical protein
MKIVNAPLAVKNKLEKCAWRLQSIFASPFLPEAILAIPAVCIPECLKRRCGEMWEEFHERLLARVLVMYACIYKPLFQRL